MQVAPDTALVTYVTHSVSGPGWKPPALRNSLWCWREGRVAVDVSSRHPLGRGFGGLIDGDNLIETYDPDLEEAIGATVSGMLDQSTAAESAAADGNFEEAFDRLFSIPIAFNNPGDFDVTLEMAGLQGSEC